MAHRIGVYPGTFDPITLGHMDIIQRGAKLVDELIIGVTTNIAKSPMFSDDERIALVEREVARIGNAKISDRIGYRGRCQTSDRNNVASAGFLDGHTL